MALEEDLGFGIPDGDCEYLSPDFSIGPLSTAHHASNDDAWLSFTFEKDFEKACSGARRRWIISPRIDRPFGAGGISCVSPKGHCPGQLVSRPLPWSGPSA